MRGIRRLIRDRRVLAMLILAAALCVKMVLPQGYMLGTAIGSRHLTVQLCFGGLTHQTVDITIPADGRSGGEKDRPHKPDVHCPYTSLGISALGGADVPLLALLVAFILARGFAPTHVVRRGQTHYLRPPLRGPPTLQ